MVKNPPANAGDMGSIPGSGRSPGEGNGNPLQYSCLENPMDRKACGLQSMGSQRVRQDWVTEHSHIQEADYLFYSSLKSFPSPPAVTWKCLQRGAAAMLLKANNNTDDDAVKDTYWMEEDFCKWQICKGINIQNRQRIYTTQHQKKHKNPPI